MPLEWVQREGRGGGAGDRLSTTVLRSFAAEGAEHGVVSSGVNKAQSVNCQLEALALYLEAGGDASVESGRLIMEDGGGCCNHFLSR